MQKLPAGEGLPQASTHLELLTRVLRSFKARGSKHSAATTSKERQGEVVLPSTKRTGTNLAAPLEAGLKSPKPPKTDSGPNPRLGIYGLITSVIINGLLLRDVAGRMGWLWLWALGRSGVFAMVQAWILRSQETSGWL